jgi:hypothetical protein
MTSDRGAVPADTDPEAYRVQIEAHRRMGPQGRAAAAFRLNEVARTLALAGIRGRHPEYDEEEVHLAYARLALGDALVLRAWPDRALVEP